MGDIANLAAAEANQSGGGFSSWLNKLSDTAFDLGRTVGTLWAEDKFGTDPVEKAPAAAGADTAAAGVVPAGQPAPVGVVNLWGLQLNKTALYVSAGALGTAVLLKLLK